MSYLDSPRIHFSGYFQSDVSTVNNNVCYYDSDAFKEQYQEYGDGGWNPQGTAIFRFVSCSVTGASLNGKPITSSAQDPIIGMAMENADQRAPGKMADLDPQQQMVSQIWALQVRLTDNVERALFIGDMLPVGFMNLWKRQQIEAFNDQTLGANYQSILENVQWHGHSRSPVLEAMRKASQHGLLAIEFNLFGYGRDPSIPRYTQGHIVGTIGPYHEREPKHFILGRQMTAQVDSNNTTKPTEGVYSFQCKNHPDRQTLTADFGNALPIIDASGAFVDLGPLTMAVLKQPAHAPISGSLSQDQVIVLGQVAYDPPQPGAAPSDEPSEWFRQTAAIQDFEYAAIPGARQALEACPLLLLSPSDDGYQVLVQESIDGLYVRSDDHVLRLNAGQQLPVSFFASRYGQPLSAEVDVGLLPKSKNPMGGGKPLPPSPPDNKPVLPPKISVPADAVRYPASFHTNDSGHGRAVVSAIPAGPGNPRGYIDGQLYGIGYQLRQQPKDYISNPWNFVSVLAFDRVPVPDHPTWYHDIRPIFVQYGNLYPIMSKYVVDLGDYDSVVRHVDILKLAFSLPMSDPNHMPVTRDLSDDKRAIILKWLNQTDAQGKPLKGAPLLKAAVVPAPREVDTDAVAVPLDDLQIAGKSAVVLQLQARRKAAPSQD
ncbi:hypothetical protein [Chromobacterium haemolyticum]|uniref:hypothetical protein n=2 Tax=Chromobacterium haemolyticum TaxID=394935 RepID=UPI00131874B4|nr:hypothetical protein [Chromobacterium haemolyticum]MDH0343712.1 hypothetical protein [Chromobacterium haemolyticum]BBH15555.1 hypothetical protein CH06BL_48030 [Chromobacterium haemolyticum]